MPAQNDLDLTLTRAAAACDEACDAVGSLSRLTLPIEKRELVRAADRHLLVAREAIFKVSRPKRPKAKQLSMEVL